MPSGPHHEVTNLKRRPGELSFDARIGDQTRSIWLRTETPVTPPAHAALAICVMPAMTLGGTLTLSDPVSPRVLRTQRQFQGIQRAWSLGWNFTDPLHEVEVIAPTHAPSAARAPGRVAAFFSGGVDSWATVLDNPDVTDLVFVRGVDLIPSMTHQADLADRVEERLRDAAATLGLRLHVIETNVRELSDPLLPWDVYCSSPLAAVSLFFEPLFERVLIAGDTDYETQVPSGSSRMAVQLWSSEALEIAEDGGRLNRQQRLRLIVDHPVVQRSLRVCWQNPDGAYNCGRCLKCILTQVLLEASGIRDRVATFPPELNLDLLSGFEITQTVALVFWEDALDATRAAGRPDLERPVADLVARGKRNLGLPATHRGRRPPGPPRAVRIGVVVPAWGQARYLAEAVQSALDQETEVGVGVVVVNDGCPDPETHRIGQALRDAHPDRVAYLRQPNGGLSAARNAGIRQAFARWPQVEAIFPLDADNMLSPQTLAKLSARLEERPEAAWATPALEFFGGEEGEWQVPGPYLLYRQLLSNQCDAGSLIRRSVFAAGIEYDETMRDGFEDWEFFLRAMLLGYQGVPAGRCGFRYRRQGESMLTATLRQATAIEGEIRRRHPAAYEPAALARREHEEAPRFGLVRCDRKDVLLTANGELEPRHLSLAEFGRSIAAAGGAEPSASDHVPAITVLTTSSTIDRLTASGRLSEALLRLRAELPGKGMVGLGVGGGDSRPAVSAIALRASQLPRLRDEARPEAEALIEIEALGEVAAEPLGKPEAEAVAAVIGTAAGEAMPLPASSHSSFFERVQIDEPLEPAAMGPG